MRISDWIQTCALPIFRDGVRPFWVLGLGDQLALYRARGEHVGLHDLDATVSLADDDAPAILLAHEPDIFPLVPRRVALTLSGHTHGGQVRVPGYSPIVPSDYGNRPAPGHHAETGRASCRDRVGKTV